MKFSYKWKDQKFEQGVKYCLQLLCINTKANICLAPGGSAP